jgi:hypothetical protein
VMLQSEHDLSAPWKAGLLLAFGASTSALIATIGDVGARPLDMLLFGASLGALVTAGLWLWILAAKRSLGWGLTFMATLWIPYVNLVVASVYARRYWSEGARAPALLAIAGMVGQTIASLRVFLPSLTPPV